MQMQSPGFAPLALSPAISCPMSLRACLAEIDLDGFAASIYIWGSHRQQWYFWCGWFRQYLASHTGLSTSKFCSSKIQERISLLAIGYVRSARKGIVFWLPTLFTLLCLHMIFEQTGTSGIAWLLKIQKCDDH